MAAKTLHVLLALSALSAAPLLGVPLGLAQSVEVAAPAAPASAAAPEPAAVVPPEPGPSASESVAPPPSTPIAAPLTPAPAAAEAPWRPGPEQRQNLPPRRFDASIDALVRDGVVTPAERVRVRGGMVAPGSALQRQACTSGALSAQECSSGVVLRGRGRSPELLAYPGGSAAPGADAGGSAGDFVGGFSTDAAPLPPISVPVTALLSGAGGSFRLTDVFGRTPRPAAIGGNGNARLLFPLIGSAITTSEFGWRLHPVMGSWLMHAGKDLAAPEGTPVVAALTGRVVMSGLAGGYGLAIEVEHDRPRRRTLYGHLSELYVKEGQMVKQGEVIGRVGSTGLSTGPHLHFELRVAEDGGWVAVDPGDLDPGGSMIAGLPGLAGGAGWNGQNSGVPTDAVALLMGQLIQTLERPRSPLPLPTAGQLPARLPASGALPAPAPLRAGTAAPLTPTERLERERG